MELKSTINIILNDLEDARDLIDDLRNYPGVPLIQIELARSKCRSAADVIRLLSTLLEEMMEASGVNRQPEEASETATGSTDQNQKRASMPDTGGLNQKQISPAGSADFDQQQPPPGENENKKEIAPDPGIAETGIAETGTAETSTAETRTADIKPESSPSTEPDKQASAKPESEKHRNVIDEIIGAYPDDHDDTADPAQEREQLKGKETPRIVADRFSHLSERINEQIGDSRNGKQEMSRVKKKITDITKEIGINDRFFLIRELFDGNQEKYKSALNELNSVTSNEEAKSIIEKYRAPSGNREAGKMLSELVRIKLSSLNG